MVHMATGDTYAPYIQGIYVCDDHGLERCLSLLSDNILAKSSQI